MQSLSSSQIPRSPETITRALVRKYDFLGSPEQSAQDLVDDFIKGSPQRSQDPERNDLSNFKLAIRQIDRMAAFLHIVNGVSEALKVQGFDPDTSKSKLTTEQAYVISKLGAPLLRHMVTMWMDFEDIARATLAPEYKKADRDALTELCQPIRDVLVKAEFPRRAIEKPEGHAGDFATVNMILDYDPENSDTWTGKSTFEILMNHYHLNDPTAVAHRNRIKMASSLLSSEMQRHISSPEKDEPFKVAVFACGPAREIVDWIEGGGVLAPTKIKLLDRNPDAIADAKRRIQEAIEKTGAQVEIETEPFDILQEMAQTRRRIRQSAESGQEAQIKNDTGERFHVALCLGLDDYFPTDRLKFSTRGLYDKLAVGGVLCKSNVTDKNPSEWIRTAVLDWALYIRDEDEMHEQLELLPRHKFVSVLEADLTGANFLQLTRKLAA